MESEGFNCGALGDFGQASLTTEQMSYLDEMDILPCQWVEFIRLGLRSAELVSEIEPSNCNSGFIINYPALRLIWKQ